jgi:hypothetical protein
VQKSDLQWLWPSLFLTSVVGAVSTVLMHVVRFTNSPDPTSLTSWFGWMVMASGVAVIVYVVRLMIAGKDRPLSILAENVRTRWRRYVAIAIGATLAGFDLYFFMILKPELNVLFPFWADPYLAGIDHWIFGMDPWRPFASWNLVVVSWLYSPFWFFSVLLTFFWLLLRPASDKKATAIIAYFAVWSVFGPVGQALLSSGGPIFYERLGFGSRFNAMPIPAVVEMLSNYLWAAYHGRSLAVGAGISAMPSLHIASMTWLTMSFAIHRSRWTIPALLLSLFIYAGSVALGWHYATDGIVGALGAVGCFYAARWYVTRGSTSASLQAETIGAAAEATSGG